jgi:hypothetical protein
MGAEKAEFQKIKRTMKLDMQAELQKVRDYTARTSIEMQRVNSLLESQRKILNLLAEDSMLMQMLQEQDLIDRKQIGLFGTKKNQQILGKNQYAMQNNLSNGESTDKQFWELRNKNKKYSKRVKSPL